MFRVCSLELSGKACEAIGHQRVRATVSSEQLSEKRGSSILRYGGLPSKIFQPSLL